MLGHYKALARVHDFPEGPDHAGISRDPAGEHQGFQHLFAAPDGTFEVPGDGEAKAGDDVVIRRGELLEVYHVRLGEHAAPPGDARRVFRLKRQLSELALYLYIQAFGLLVQE